MTEDGRRSMRSRRIQVNVKAAETEVGGWRLDVGRREETTAKRNTLTAEIKVKARCEVERAPPLYRMPNQANNSSQRSTVIITRSFPILVWLVTCVTCGHYWSFPTVLVPILGCSASVPMRSVAVGGGGGGERRWRIRVCLMASQLASQPHTQPSTGQHKYNPDAGGPVQLSSGPVTVA
jgi:hypothetical protein